MTIPSTIHYIFGLSEDFGGKPFSYFHHLCVRSALAVNPSAEIVFHVAHEPRGEWWDAVRPHIALNKVSPPTAIFGRELRHFAHRADALRLQILRSEGGVYMDVDVFCVRPFAPLLDRDMVLGIEPGQGLCNAVILAAPGAEFLDLWYEAYREFDDASWNTHSVKLPYRLAKEHPHLIHVLDGYAFFFPLYNDPSSEIMFRRKLPPDALVLSGLKDLRRMVRPADPLQPRHESPFLKHALWSTERYYRQLQQSYCIHLWESLWWKYLGDLTPEKLHASEGLFRRLVDDVLEGVPGVGTGSPAPRPVLEPAG